MRLIVADDEQNVRFALRTLLSRERGIIIVAEASHGSTLKELVDRQCPELLIVDWSLPGLAEIGSLDRLKQCCPEMQVIVLSGRPERQAAAMAAGASAFVSKMEPPERLLSAINDCACSRQESDRPADRPAGHTTEQCADKTDAQLVC